MKQQFLIAIASILVVFGMLLVILDFTLVPDDYNTIDINFDDDLEITFNHGSFCSSSCHVEVTGPESFSEDFSSSFSKNIVSKRSRSGVDVFEVEVSCFETGLFCDDTIIKEGKIISFTHPLDTSTAKPILEEAISNLDVISAYSEALNQENIAEEEISRLISFWEEEDFNNLIEEINTFNLPELKKSLNEEFEKENDKRQIIRQIKTSEVESILNSNKTSESIEKIATVVRTLQLNESIYPLITNSLADINRINETCIDCINRSELFILKNYSYQKNITFNIKETEIPEIRGLCCYQSCNECKEKSDVVLFVHGHAFLENSLPSTEMQSFANIQSNLSFLNGGVLTPFNDLNWSRLGETTTFRTTYYEFFTENEIQKSERIENYALRLKDRIDEAKKAGGKVHLVGHSMGGLVIRKYIDLFGDNKLGEIIFINSPQNGVTNSIYNLCKTFGSDKECDDMKEGSAFISSLPIPRNSHNLVSVGCKTSGEEGDGIVTRNNTMLDKVDTYIINGTCSDSLGISLHSDTLNPSLYPEVVEIIENILN